MLEPAATHPLHRLPFEWHDLTVGRISIVGKGVVIDVLPYNDEAGRYDYATLSLVEAEAFAFDIQGEFPFDVLDGLEITDFDFAVSHPAVSRAPSASCLEITCIGRSVSGTQRGAWSSARRREPIGKRHMTTKLRRAT